MIWCVRDGASVSSHSTSERMASPISVASVDNKADRWCATGALHRAMHEKTITASQHSDMRELLATRLASPWPVSEDHYGSRIMRWNDTPGRTQAEIVSLLKWAEGKVLGEAE